MNTKNAQKIRAATPADADLLWTLLYEAAHMRDAGETLDDARANPLLARYVEGWGQAGDLGFVALAADGAPVGAAWLRLMRAYGFVRDDIPELTVALLPEHTGQGLGTALIERLVAAARGLHPALSLSVRRENPAARLYARLGFVEVAGSAITNRVGSTSVTQLLWDDPVVRQLQAYRRRDIDAFAAEFAEDVRVYTYPDILQYTGRDALYDRYKGYFAAHPQLRCDLVSRIRLGTRVIDEEHVYRIPGQPHLHALAIYEVQGDLITEVRFLLG